MPGMPEYYFTAANQVCGFDNFGRLRKAGFKYRGMRSFGLPVPLAGVAKMLRQRG